ncbi:MAG: hypothetical protein AAGH74_01680 [Pseudomonadota bacterium]
MTKKTTETEPTQLNDEDLEGAQGAFLRSAFGGVIKGTKQVVETAVGVVPGTVRTVKNSFRGSESGGPTSMGGGSRPTDFSTTKHRH